MYFQKGDWFEVSGGAPQEVVYADDTCFVSREGYCSPTQGLFMTNSLKIYSNRQSDYKDKYWIKKTISPKEFRPLPYDVL